MKVNRPTTEELLEHTLSSLDKLVMVRTLMGPWDLASDIGRNLFLLGLEDLARDTLDDCCMDGALVDGPVDRIKELRRKVYEYLEMGE